MLLSIPVARNTGSGTGPVGCDRHLRARRCVDRAHARSSASPTPSAVIIALQLVMIGCWLISVPLGVMGVIFAIWLGASSSICAANTADGSPPVSLPGADRHRPTNAAQPIRPLGTERRSMTVTERTLVLVKPDGVARALVGEIIARIERKGLRLVSAGAAHDRRRDWPASTTRSTSASRSSIRLSTSSPRDRWWLRSSRASGRSRHSGRSPAAPTRWRRPRRAASAATSGWPPSRTWCTVPTPPDSAAREIALWFPGLD